MRQLTMRCVFVIIIGYFIGHFMIMRYLNNNISVDAPISVVFLHLPKTAGTTFTYMLYNKYSNSVHPMSQKHESLDRSLTEFMEFTSNKSSRWHLLSLHEDFSMLSFVVPTVSVLTIIRSPIAHRRSVFYSGLNDYIKKYNGDILQWLLSDDYPTAYQLDFLAGVSNVYPKSRYSTTILNEIRSDLELKLKIAKRNLAATTWFGITEHWNISMCMYQSVFGKIPADYELHHILSPGYPPLKPNEAALISTRSYYEQEFFEWALDLFNQRKRRAYC
jgi:hypothetical protein